MDIILLEMLENVNISNGNLRWIKFVKIMDFFGRIFLKNFEYIF